MAQCLARDHRFPLATRRYPGDRLGRSFDAVGMGVFNSTGYHEDGTPYDRPGRATVAFSRHEIGDDWVADHTHMSLFRDVPTRSFRKKDNSFSIQGTSDL